MSKILPINLNPYIRTYTHHGYFHAITSTEDKVSTEEPYVVADIEITNFHQYEWGTQNDQLTYKEDPNSHLSFFSNRWNLGMNMAFFRAASCKDEIEISINHQLFSNAWSSIMLFITDSNNMTDFHSHKICLGNFAKDGIFYSTQDNIHNRVDRRPAEHTVLKLIKEDNEIYIEYRNDEINSNGRLHIGQLDNTITDYKIGFAINLGDNIYYEYLFSNYIQLTYNYSQWISLDIIYNPQKDWVYHTFNLLIDYAKESQYDVQEKGFTLLEYIKKQIDLDNYVEIELNDNINLGVTDENGKFFHQDLIYGYSNEEQCLYLLYYHIGRTYFTKMSYEIFESDRNYNKHRFLYSLKYNPAYEDIKISPKRLLQLYKEYRDEENISNYYVTFTKDFTYGLGCLKIIYSEQGIDLLCSDIRLSHLLYEHAVCNKDRMDYLYAKKILSKEQCDSLVPILEKEIDFLCIIQNKIMKSAFGHPFNKDKILEYTKQILVLEQRFTTLVIETLEECV